MPRCVPTPARLCDDRNASDPRVVNHIFTFGDWTVRYCPPAVKSSRLHHAPPWRVSAQFWMLTVLRLHFRILHVAFLVDIAPLTYQNLPEPYPACGFSRLCLPRFAHHLSDLTALAIRLSAHRGFRVLFVKPLSSPAASDPGELITECFLIDVYDPALCTEGQLVQTGAVLLVSCRAGDGGWLLPATHAQILTGELMTCDWLRPVTQEVWLVAPPINVEAHTTVSYFGCSGWVMCTRITCANRRSVDVCWPGHMCCW